MRTTVALSLLVAAASLAQAQPGIRREVKLVSLPGEADFREVLRQRGPIRLEIAGRFPDGEVLIHHAGQSFRGFAPSAWIRGDRRRAWIHVPLNRIFFAFSTRQVRLADPRADQLHEIASQARAGRTYAFRLEAEDDGRGCLVWAGTVQVWELADLHGDAVERARISAGVETNGWAPLSLGPGVAGRLAPRTVTPVVAIAGDEVDVLVSGPGQSVAVARLCRRDVRPVLLPSNRPRLQLRASPSSRPIGLTHARRDPTPLHGRDRSQVPLVLLPGTPMQMLGVEERVGPSRLYPRGGTWLRVAVPGLRGWIEGHVLDEAGLDEPIAPLAAPVPAPRNRGFSVVIEGEIR